ncbi:hypothetical protein PINS_up014664 [Pythium insidiosum]|nr:hypothetical protein PINS_up012987 [Pythium insidiosum]GLE05626.1 hypothetical protein PINS_up014664 [Pythium insidiosum]
MAPPRHQQASVVFGYDGSEYVTSSAAMNEKAGIVAPERADVKTQKECFVVFGEPGKKRDFTKSSTLADPTGEVHKYTAKLNEESKRFLLTTSSSFGSEQPSYVTSTQLATQWNKAAVEHSIAMRNETRKRTGPRPTRGMSYDDEIEYVSEAKSQFVNKLKEFKPSLMAEAVKNGA